MNKKKNKGSGILVIVFASIAFSIYAMSSYAQVEHFGILLNRYEKNNKDIYEKYVNNIEDFYDLYYNINESNDDIMYR